ncbi:MAG: serine/threonine protein phosphatase PrpC [Kiritimatiellia bacterium]|jgi:serine/threonine protein phosphatase PrpC
MVKVGVQCSKGIGASRGGAPEHTDNYLLGADRQVSWCEGPLVHSEPADGKGVVMAVCDGFGVNGRLASSSTVRVLAKIYQPVVPRNPPEALLNFVSQAHDRLHQAAAKKGRVRMGASVTLAWVIDGKVHWLQVGHSRMYLYRRGQLIRLTADHTRGEFALRDGRTAPSDPDLLAQCFLYGSRDLGSDQSLRLELGLDVGTEYLEPGDRLLLCTDGLWRFVSKSVIMEILRNVDDPQSAASRLVERAFVEGSTDNVTAMVGRVDWVPPNTITEIDRPVSYTFS